ncbi:cytochrome-c peroxidase [Cupriavidus consociatus]|uniref:cytochrome-c peroxidase n=1 Tax=Cupriavidus consociatus TaxID=2821357 RepID=UPI001AE9914A|nr:MULTISPECIES: cytochrome c peroxidase [unclassified Cupriavidus]MBP0619522.1 cytochrome-c peroxidase [Cupriavidus sp. LEh25]MDK2656170.1 cytochrome c peroxidase [Cupriavidus sp. LEh21]
MFNNENSNGPARPMLMAAILAAALSLTSRTPHAQVVDPLAGLRSLKTVTVPGPPAEVLDEFVKDKAAAIQLGKALFWDMKVGSDNKTSCASCHFHAGVDNRITNQLSPGLLGGDKTFQLGGPNYTFKPEDFGFTKHVEVNQSQPQLSNVNEVSGSQGVFTANFVEFGTGSTGDVCANVSDDIFHGGTGFNINGINTRQVTGRNTPSVINAVFNFRNFWDGRANNMYNGGDPFGMRNPEALVWKNEGGVVKQAKLAIPGASLASQSDGPPLSSVEMSCNGRSFMKLGKKLLGQRPLSGQVIAADDSVLGPLVLLRSKDQVPTYSEMIKKAFRSQYWNSPTLLKMSAADEAKFASMDLLPPRQFKRSTGKFEVSQMEANFALFFGLAVHLYESTLIANDTPVDRYLEGQTTALNEQQLRGARVFTGAGRCGFCHSGPEFTAASFSSVTRQRLRRMPMGDGLEAVYDNGFYNIGVQPTTEDLGVGGTDPFGNPLSETRMAQQGKTHLLGNGFDTAKETAVDPTQRVAVDGAFKAPGLRNLEFTGPYFHNGGKSTLLQVVDFYNRGGDFADVNRANLDRGIAPLGLTEQQKLDLVAFLLALGDDRVRYRKAPFDHPSLCFPQGHKVNGTGGLEQDGTTGNGVDKTECIGAVGAGGASSGLKPFLNLDPFQR